MGLDTTHNCYHGPYSRFSAWRNSLAEALDWTIGQDRIGTHYQFPDNSPDITEDIMMGKWDENPTDVIFVLMLHQDCEGIIPHRFCEPLARRLEELIDKQDEEWEDTTFQFITGLLNAHVRGEDVDFH